MYVIVRKNKLFYSIPRALLTKDKTAQIRCHYKLTPLSWPYQHQTGQGVLLKHFFNSWSVLKPPKQRRVQESVKETNVTSADPEHVLCSRTERKKNLSRVPVYVTWGKTPSPNAKKKIAVNLRKCQKLTGAAQTATRAERSCSSVAPVNGNEAVQFGFARAQGTGCNWWAPSCHLSTFLKWSQGTCAPICTDSLCKIKPRWKPVWGHKMPAIISQFCSSTSAAKSPGFGGAGIFVFNSALLPRHRTASARFSAALFGSNKLFYH